MRNFEAEASVQIEEEDRVKFGLRIRERARLLREQSRQIGEGMQNFPQTATERKAQLDRLIVREQELAGPPRQTRNLLIPTTFTAAVPRVTSVAADDELQRVRDQIWELRRLCKLDGTLKENAA